MRKDRNVMCGSRVLVAVQIGNSMSFVHLHCIWGMEASPKYDTLNKETISFCFNSWKGKFQHGPFNT